MKNVFHNTRENSPSLEYVRREEFGIQLNDFYQSSNQTPDILKSIFENAFPSLSIFESIIYIYSNSLYKTIINSLLDKTIDYLHLNNDDNLLKNPYYLKQIEINQSSNNCNLLHYTIENNYEHIFQLLSKSHFNPNSLSSSRRTPLFTAVSTVSINPIKRLEYSQQLITYGGNPVLRDINNNSLFGCLCRIETNYPIVYTYFRDYLLSIDPNEAQKSFNIAVKTAFYNRNVDMLIDLLEHGAIYPTLKIVDDFSNFLQNRSRTIFQGNHYMTHINPYILGFIQLILHNNPCENYSVCIELFIRLIYIPCVCLGFNHDTFNYPSLIYFKNFLFVSFHYGYLSKHWANCIQMKSFPKILPKEPQLYDTLIHYSDELITKYHKNPVSLTLISIRKIRKLMNNITREKFQQLNLTLHLQNMLLID